MTLARLHLAIERVMLALDRADYDSGHIITSDNVKIMDVRMLLDAALSRCHPPQLCVPCEGSGFVRRRDTDGSREAGETPKSGSPRSTTAGAEGIAPTQSEDIPMSDRARELLADEFDELGYVTTAKTLRENDEAKFTGADRLALRAIDKAIADERAAIVAKMRKTIERGYPSSRDIGKCQHGRYYFEDCIGCYDDFLSAELDGIELGSHLPLVGGE